MEADIQTLYQSAIGTVHNFLCQCRQCKVSGKEYQETFSIAYIRKGNFRFKVFRNDLDAYSGLFLLCKPGYEHQVAHIHDIPDECTIFSFPAESAALLQEQAAGFDWFFHNPDIQSVLVKATPEMELLHQHIFHLLGKPHYPQLWVEQLMTTLFLRVLSAGNDLKWPVLSDKQKRNYLPVIETVKAFIHENHTDVITLPQLAALGHLSPFHFNRLFRQVTTTTPYHYLLQVRLQQAHLQLRHTNLPVTDIAFSSGFNSLEHFSAAYKKQFGKSPLATRC
ncbi:AraC-like DNA-binding protein [Chitinophaga polysaccharea]|uniref:AraC-like DNA-binding protein n=1 Tax=Chitinophaga polysaccharea TaxID=1293035 RepID=A0A561P3S2_9BACT|nr:helix-turn-helix transcriptional regulator [Chitinophaga polysaccharea]TWF32763.1 AraC-like DNA-binding protein [Chitinophaga polysaccharea]